MDSHLRDHYDHEVPDPRRPLADDIYMIFISLEQAIPVASRRDCVGGCSDSERGDLGWI